MFGGGLSQLLLYGMLEQNEINEKLSCFYDVNSINNLNNKCKLCEKRLNIQSDNNDKSLVVCLWCNKAVHKQCIDEWFKTNKKQCPYCTSNCFEYYDSNLQQT